MRYFVITKELADKIKCTSYRYGDDKGYLVNSTDIALYGIDKAVDDGDATFVTAKGANEFLSGLRERINNPEIPDVTTPENSNPEPEQPESPSEPKDQEPETNETPSEPAEPDTSAGTPEENTTNTTEEGQNE